MGGLALVALLQGPSPGTVKLREGPLRALSRKYEGGQIWINPRHKTVTANCIGLFITQSSDAVKRAWFYCRVCHEKVTRAEEIRKCSCKKLAKQRYDYYKTDRDTKNIRSVAEDFV